MAEKTVKVIHQNNVGDGLQISSNKLVLKLDNRTVQLNERGEVTVVARTDVHASNLRIDGTRLVVERSGSTPLNVDLADFRQTPAELKSNASGNVLQVDSTGKLFVPDNLAGDDVLIIQDLAGNQLAKIKTKFVA